MTSSETSTNEANTQIQPAFVKRSKRTSRYNSPSTGFVRKYPRKYYTINKLMDIILPLYPNIETLAVLFNSMSQGKYNKVNIEPLAAVVIDQKTEPNRPGTQHKLDYAKLMDITITGITHISVPNMVFDHGEFDNIELRRLDIEATTTETSDGAHTYHKSQLSNKPPSQNILENLRLERTRVLGTFVPKVKETSPVEEVPDEQWKNLLGSTS